MAASSTSLSESIRKRFRDGDPLNISAVRREAPDLLHAAFSAKPGEPFLGWRGALRQAGIDYPDIVIHLGSEVICPICGATKSTLMSHLSRVHGSSAEEVRRDDPDFEPICDEILAERAAMLPAFTPQGKKLSATTVPHWEPLWSREYAIDRLHFLHEAGYPVHFRGLDEVDLTLKAYIHRRFESFDDCVRKAGLDPDDIRRLRHRYHYSREFLLGILQESHLRGESLALTHLGRRYPGYRQACQKVFGTHREALLAAGIDVRQRGLKFVRLKDKRQLRTAARRILEEHPAGIPEDALVAFRTEWDWMVAKHYGGWGEFARSMRVNREAFYRAARLYPKEELLEAARRIKKRKHWTPDDAASFRETYGFSLSRHFSDWEHLARLAGVDLEQLGLEPGAYGTSAGTLAGLKQLQRSGTPMLIGCLKRSHPGLRRGIDTHFQGDWYAAFQAAGISPGRRPRRDLGPDDVLDALRARHAAGQGVLNRDLSTSRARGGDTRLHAATLLHFGSVEEALRQAGLPAAKDLRAMRQGPSVAGAKRTDKAS